MVEKCYLLLWLTLLDSEVKEIIMHRISSLNKGSEQGLHDFDGEISLIAVI